MPACCERMALALLALMPSAPEMCCGTPGGHTDSGFVCDAEGHLVTRDHVAENARRIVLSLADDTIVEAKMTGADSDGDLAMIRTEKRSARCVELSLALWNSETQLNGCS